MYCTKCGRKIDDDSTFCPYCGTTIPHDSIDDTMELEPIQEEKPVEEVKPEPKEPPVQKQKPVQKETPVRKTKPVPKKTHKKKKNFFATGAGEAVIAVAIGVAFFSGGFAFSVNRKDQPKESQNQTQETGNADDKTVAPDPFTKDELEWVSEPGSLDVSTFENLEGAGNNGFVFIKEGFKENKGYGTDWTNPDKGVNNYTSDAIVVKKGDNEGIYSFDRNEIDPVEYVNIGWNYYNDVTFTYENSGSKSDYSFDSNFNPTGQLQRDDNNRTYELPHFRGIYNGKIVNDVKNGNLTDNGDGTSDGNQILPVISENVFVTVDAKKGLPYSYDADYTKLSSAVTGFALKDDHGKITDLPKGMKPTYWDDFIAIYGTPDNKTYVDTYRDQEAFVNGVIKLTDGKGIRLWDTSKKDYIGKDSYEDATYYEEGYIGVKKNGKWGFMDKSGNMVSDYLFDNVSAIQDGKVYVTYNGKVGILNLKASMKKAGIKF